MKPKTRELMRAGRKILEQQLKGNPHSIELNNALDAWDRLEKNFTGENYSRAPLVIMEASLLGELSSKQLRTICRKLEAAWKAEIGQ
jgi:hypothetical protein